MVAVSNRAGTMLKRCALKKAARNCRNYLNRTFMVQKAMICLGDFNMKLTPKVVFSDAQIIIICPDGETAQAETQSADLGRYKQCNKRNLQNDTHI